MSLISPDPVPERSPAQKRLVRRVFGACIVLLLCQYGLISLVGEPYPAVVLPSFSGTGFVSHSVTVPRVTVRFLSGGRVVASCPHFELLAGIPDAHHLKIAQHVLSPLPGDGTPAEPTSHRTTLLLRLMPGYARAGREHRAGRIPESLRKWLRKRADDLAPHARIDQVEVCWEAVTYDMNQRPPTVTEEILDGELSIRLKEPGDAPTRVASY